MSNRDGIEPCFMCGQLCDASTQTKQGWVCTPCVRVCVEVTVAQLGNRRTAAFRDVRRLSVAA